MPASVFSRSTECHNQDKVSMGTIAARDCVRILELTEQVAAACLLSSTQALQLRINAGDIPRETLPVPLQAMLDNIQQDFAFVSEDRPLEKDLRLFIEKIRQRHWALYERDMEEV
jgi:histidine ammonia-lyase